VDSIKASKWKPWRPRLVLIVVDQFMEKNHDGQSHWIPIDNRMAIQGLLAERKEDAWFYAVTIDTPPEYAWVHDELIFGSVAEVIPNYCV